MIEINSVQWKSCSFVRWLGCSYSSEQFLHWRCNSSLSNENWIEGISWRFLGTPTLSSRFYTSECIGLKSLCLLFCSCVFLKRSLFASVSRNFSVHINKWWTPFRSVDLGRRKNHIIETPIRVIEDRSIDNLLVFQVRQLKEQK